MADAPAQIRDGLTTDIGDAHSVASCLSALAESVVIGERLARIQYDAVDGLRGQADVGDAVAGAAAERGLTVVQAVAEQQFIQHVLRDRRFRIDDIKGQCLPRFCCTVSGLCGGKIKTHAGHGLRESSGGFVINGRKRIHMDGFVQGIQIHRSRMLGGHFKGPGFTCLNGGLQPVRQSLHYLICVHRIQTGSLYKSDAVLGHYAGLGVCQPVISFDGLGDPLQQNAVVIAGIDVVHQVQSALSGVIGDGILNGISAAPVGHGLGGEAFCAGGDPEFLRPDGNGGPVRKSQLGVQIVGDGLSERIQSLLFRHSGDIHSVDSHTGEDSIQLADLVHQNVACRACSYEHDTGDNGSDYAALPAALLLLLGLFCRAFRRILLDRCLPGFFGNGRSGGTLPAAD